MKGSTSFGTTMIIVAMLLVVAALFLSRYVIDMDLLNMLFGRS